MICTKCRADMGKTLETDRLHCKVISRFGKTARNPRYLRICPCCGHRNIKSYPNLERRENEQMASG